MLAILNPVHEVFNFISNAAHYLLVISYLAGKGIYYILSQICSWIGIFFHGIAIVLEELWLFVREVHLSINDAFTYIESSTNRGVCGVLKGFSIFTAEISRFLTNGKLHSKFLASAVGRGVVNFFEVIRGGLLLIADSVWFIVTIIPKSLFNSFIYVGDLIVFAIHGIWKMLLLLLQNFMDELFRYIIAGVVLFVVLKNRRRIYWATRRWTIRFVQTIIRWSVRVFRFLFVLRQPPPPPRNGVINGTYRQSTAISRNSTPGLNKSNESICCVVCRDRPKCVLLLPCKHLCMCQECAEFIIAARQAYCPLCRSTVHKQLSVYI